MRMRIGSFGRQIGIVCSCATMCLVVGCDRRPPDTALVSAIEPRVAAVIPESWEGMEPLVRARIKARVADVEQSPDAKTWAALGRAYHVHRYIDLAQPCYEQSLMLDETDARTRYFLAHVYSELGNVEHAIASLDAATNHAAEPEPAFFVWRRGYWLTRLGRLADAERAFNTALETNAQEPAARIGLARVAQLVGQHDEVVRILLPIVEQPIQNAGYARHLLGISLIQLGEEETGRSMLSRQPQNSLSWPDPWLDNLQRDRTDEQWLLGQAQTLIRTGQINEGLAMLEPLLEHYPDDPGILKIQGMAAFASGDMPAAVELMQRVVDRQPDDAGAQLNLAFALEQVERWPEAIAAAQRAIVLDPANPHPKVQLGRSMARAGNTAEAIEHLTALVEEHADFVPGLVWLGHAYADAGRPDDARTMLDRAAQRSPAGTDVLQLQRRLFGG